jgi:hypothetical protein
MNVRLSAVRTSRVNSSASASRRDISLQACAIATFSQTPAPTARARRRWHRQVRPSRIARPRRGLIPEWPPAIGRGACRQAPPPCWTVPSRSRPDEQGSPRAPISSGAPAGDITIGIVLLPISTTGGAIPTALSGRDIFSNFVDVDLSVIATYHQSASHWTKCDISNAIWMI